MTSPVPALIVVLPLTAALAAPVIGRFLPRALGLWTGGVLSAVTGLSLYAFHSTMTAGPWRYVFGGWPAPWGIEYVIDPLGAGMASAISVFALLTFLYARRDELSSSGVYQALFLLCVTGLLGIVVTGDLFNLYVFLEIASLASYALVAAGPRGADMAAYRYLLLGSVGAAFWVLGIGLLYDVTGTLNMADMTARLSGVPAPAAVTAALGLITAGLALKMAVFPLHGWQPEAYARAPSAVMPFLSAVSAKTGAYVLYRMCHFVLAQAPSMDIILSGILWLGLTTIVAGSVMALRQRDLKRLLAYSSVGQIGYVLVGVGLGNAWGLIGALLHILDHAVMKSSLFMAAGLMARRDGTCRLEDCRGAGKTMPLTAACFTTSALALVGLPPAGAFFSKWYLIWGGFQKGQWPVALVLAAGTLLSAAYFFRVIERMYFRAPEEPPHAPPLSGRLTAAAPMLFLSAAALILGFVQGPLVRLAGACLPPGITP